MTISLRPLWLSATLMLALPAQAGLLQAIRQIMSAPAPVAPVPETEPVAEPAPEASAPAAATAPEPVDSTGESPSASGLSINWAQWGLAESSALAVINAPIGRSGLLPDPLPEDSPAPLLDELSASRYNPYGNMLPYVIRGEPYSLRTLSLGKRQEGVASWYGPGFNGRRTASGEIFDMHQLTAAHRTLPLPSFVRVTNLANQQSVIVRINDRGPFHAGRILDLSYAAARKIDLLHVGKVSIEPVESAAKEPVMRAGVPLPAGETVYTVVLGNFTDPAAAQSLQGRLMARLPAGILVSLVSSRQPISAHRVEVGPLLSMQEVKLLIRAIRAVRLGVNVETPRLRPRKP